MHWLITRRQALGGTIAATFSLTGSRLFAATNQTLADARQRLIELERKNGGRLGVAMLDSGSGVRLGNRQTERIAMCSTFKFLAVAHILLRVDKGEEHLDRHVSFAQTDLMPNSPTTKNHVADGMSVAGLCEAAITLSDNTAANILLASSGGPAGFTAYARSLGDYVTRLDRIEPQLNDVKPGDERDTTTPAAMLEDLRKVLLGDALSPASREQLINWMVANKTGDKRLRAGLPKDWRVADKTGTSGTGIFNDIGVAWPRGRAPILIAVYFADSMASDDQRNAVIAEVGAIAATL